MLYPAELRARTAVWNGNCQAEAQGLCCLKRRNPYMGGSGLASADDSFSTGLSADPQWGGQEEIEARADGLIDEGQAAAMGLGDFPGDGQAQSSST